MSLDYRASFSGAGGEELLPMHEKQFGDYHQLKDDHLDASDNGRKAERLPSVIGRLISGIPPQDQISERKEKIQKWKMLTLVLVLSATFIGFWAYNSLNRVTSLKIKDIDTLKLPQLMVCIPLTTNLTSTPHGFYFQHFNLTHVRQPGDFRYTEDIKTLCTSDMAENNCGDFIKYDGACINIGSNIVQELQWNLTTTGRDILSIVFVYPRLSYISVMHLIIPYFGWVTDCTMEKDGSIKNSDKCTEQTHFGLFTETTKNPLLLYQVEPNQLALVEVHKQVHVDSYGDRTELYLTSIINHPFARNDELIINQMCRNANIFGECDAIYIGIRSLSQTITTTYEERYFLSVVRSFLNSAALVSVITAVCTFIFAFLVTKITFKEKQAHIDHDLREAIIYMHKVMNSNKENIYA